MRAFLTLNDDNLPAVKGPLTGQIMPYICKSACVPLFTFDTPGKMTFHMNTSKEIEAPPGMIGMSVTGELHVVLADKECVPLPVRLLTGDEYDLFVEWQMEKMTTQEAEA